MCCLMKFVPDLPNKTSSKLGVLVPPWRAVFTFSFAMFCTFTSYASLNDLQSSLLYENNLGSTSLGLIYSLTVVLSIFASSSMYMFSLQCCVIYAMFAHLLYVISNFNPTSSVILTSSAILSTGMTLTMSSMPMYIVGVSQSYINLHDMPPEKTDGVRSMFNGIFFFFFKGTHLVGNLISSLVLSESRYNMHQVEHNVCGASICNANDKNGSIVIVDPEQNEVNTLLLIYIGVDILGLFIIIFCTPFFDVWELDSELNVEQSKPSSSPSSSFLSGSNSTLSIFMDHSKILLQIWKDIRFWLLIPLFLGQAMFIMIMYATYTQGFVSCAIGVQWVGYSMVCLGASGAVSSALVNYLAKYTGRVPLFMVSIFIDIGCLVVMLLWKPNSDTSFVTLFIIPFASGISEGIVQPQILVLLSSIFKEKKSAAFTASASVRGAAFSITLFTLSTICLYQQFSIALTFYMLGFIGYIVTEIREYRLNRALSVSDNNTSISERDTTIATPRDNVAFYGSVMSHGDGIMEETLLSK